MYRNSTFAGLTANSVSLFNGDINIANFARITAAGPSAGSITGILNVGSGLVAGGSSNFSSGFYAVVLLIH